MVTRLDEIQAYQVHNIEELESLPNYIKNVDPSTVDFVSIVGWYKFADKIICQKSNCHTPHNIGYVVELSNGSVTNIGNHCGNEFGAENFQLQKALVENYKKRQILLKLLEEKKQTFSDFSFQNIKNTCSSLKRAQDHLGELLGRTLLSKLRVRAQHKDLTVNRERLATEKEIEIKKASGEIKDNKRNYYIEEKVGVFTSIDFLIADAHKIHLTIKTGIELLLQSALEELNAKDLKKVSETVLDAEEGLKKIANYMVNQEIFFNQIQNYNLLQSLADQLPEQEAIVVKAKIDITKYNKFFKNN